MEHPVLWFTESSGGFLPPRPMPCTLSYLSTLTTLEDKYAHIRECTGARRSYSGMRRATRGREASYVRYGWLVSIIKLI